MSTHISLPDYEAFLKGKVRLAESWGFPIEASEVNPALKPHQRDIVMWNVAGGRRANFASFGLGKSVIQLETVRLILAKAGGMGLIVCPLGVRQEFVRDALSILKWEKAPRFVRTDADCDDPNGFYLTNYESVRDGKLDPANFTVASLDEAAVLRGFGGSKTFREFMLKCTGDGGPSGRMRDDGKTLKYRFVATATPSPNEYIEILAYADFLGIMDISQAKTRFFKRDSTKADKLTLHIHKEREFWLWVASWAMFIQKPSDLGHDDAGYTMPELQVHWHCVSTDNAHAGYERGGQGKLLRDAAIGLQDAAAEKRVSMVSRIAKVVELRNSAPDEHCIVWHHLEDERHAIQKALPEAVSVWGSQDLDEREKRIIGFSDGEFKTLSTKEVIAGSGCNFQRYCAWEIFSGIGFKFADFIQALHRVLRFLQTRNVRIDIIYTEAEYAVKKILETKWEQHNKLVANMTAIIQQFGMSKVAMAHTLTRKMGTERIEVKGERHRLVNDDTVKECATLPANSLDLVLTSIPFSTQYEYSPNFADFGHSEGNSEFWEQMDFLTPSLFAALKPGRLACIHVKDRIVPGGMTGLGFQTVYPFHKDCIEHFTTCPECRYRIAVAKHKGEKWGPCTHRFAYMGKKTIITDVVRENNQTYRLGWSEQCKDGSKMGVGMPEELLIFRKPPTDRSNSYADEPVQKSKEEYSLARWQVDAHGFTRSSGNRHITPDELLNLSHADIFQLFKGNSLQTIYDFEHHVKIGEALAAKAMLPVTFMLLQPQSWSDEVWTDITRMLTLNGSQWSKGKEMHLCPMQFDIADRCIEQFTMPGELVLDPFSGLGTVPYRAVLKGRRAIGHELNAAYFLDSCAYCKAAEEEVMTPSLFDLEGIATAQQAA